MTFLSRRSFDPLCFSRICGARASMPWPLPGGNLALPPAVVAPLSWAAEDALLVDGDNKLKSATAQAGITDRQCEEIAHTVQHHWHRPDRWQRAGRQTGRAIIGQKIPGFGSRADPTDWLHRLQSATRPALPNKGFYTTDSWISAATRWFGLGRALPCDLCVYFTNANVLAAGGVVSSAGWPLLGRPADGSAALSVPTTGC
jgi:hypothetical protein